MKPQNYPLPWCTKDDFDCPYYKINLWLINHRKDWAKWQSHRPMSEIIPEIDKLIDSDEI